MTEYPPLDVAEVDPTEEMPPPATHHLTAPPASPDAGGALARHASLVRVGATDAWRRIRRAAPASHPDAWEVDLLRSGYPANAALYHRVKDTHDAAMAAWADADRQRRAQLARVAAASLVGALAAWALFGRVTVLTCCVAASAASCVAAWTHGRRVTDAAIPRCDACGTRVTDATQPPTRHASGDATHDRRGDATRVLCDACDPRRDRTGDAPPPASATVDAVNTALRHAQILKGAPDAAVTAPTPMVTAGAPNGWQVRVTLPPEVKGGTRVLLAAAGDVAAAFDRPPYLAHVDPVPGRGLAARLWIADRDPLTGPPVLSPLATLDRVDNVRGPVEVGTSVTGERCTIVTTGEIHSLMTGDTGSGKSGLAGLTIARAALYPWATPIIVDPNRSARWAAYRQRGHVISGGDPDQLRLAARVLMWCVNEMDARYLRYEQHLDAHPTASTEDDVTLAMERHARLGLHHIPVVIDEAHTLFGSSAPYDPAGADGRSVGDVARYATQQLVTRSRRANLNVHVVTQRGSTTNVAGDIRALLQSKAMFATTDPNAATMGLGPSWRERGMDPLNRLQGRRTTGCCYLLGAWLAAPEADWVLARLDHLDVTAHRLIAGRGATLVAAHAPHLASWAPAPLAPLRPPAPLPALLEALAEITAGGPAHVDDLAAGLADRGIEVTATRTGLDQALAAVPGVNQRCERVQIGGRRDYGLRGSDVATAVAQHRHHVACQPPAGPPAAA